MTRILFLLVGLGLVLSRLSPPNRTLRQSELRPVVLRPALAKTLSRSQLPLLIDLYWLRVLNAIGEADSAQKNRDLYAYGVVLTELDPRFRTAYSYIGLNIPFQYERNKYKNGDLAIDLLERGVRQFPNDMQLHLYLGFTMVFVERHYREAADVFLRGSKLPNAPRFMAGLATRLLSQSGQAGDALKLARDLAASTEDEEVKSGLEQRVQELEVEVLLQQVDAAASQFKQRTGHDATSLDELVAAGDYRGPTEDSRGGTVSLKDGKGTSTSLERRVELYE